MQWPVMLRDIFFSLDVNDGKSLQKQSWWVDKKIQEAPTVIKHSKLRHYKTYYMCIL